MKIKILALAWRNLWRSKRRTLITIASVVFSVFFAAIMRSMQEGSYDKMIDNMVKFYTGYLQIQDSAYWNDRSIDNSIQQNESFYNHINQVKDVLLVTPRIESYALAANDEKSKAVFVLGIEPEKEDKIIKLSHKIIEGNLLKSNENGIMITEGLARLLNIKLKDTLVLISQGYHGVSAAEKFAVHAIFKHPSPDFNNSMILMSLKTAQLFFSLENRVSSEVIMVKSHHKVKHVKDFISNHLDPSKRVMTWEEMQPEMVSMINGDRAGSIIMLLVLYLVIGFGIFGTAMMMINERKREFAVVNSLGMTKTQINLVIATETLLIGIIGSLAGLLFTAPLIWYFYNNPIPISGDMGKVMEEYGIEPFYYVSVRASLFINQALTVFFLCSSVALISMISVYRMKMIKNLRA